MSWLMIDDQFHADPTITAIGDEAAGTFVRACSYCAANLTDGWVEQNWAKKNIKPRIRMLLCTPPYKLWHPVQGGEEFEVETKGDKGRMHQVTIVVPGPGLFIPKYLYYNPTRERVEQARKSRKERGSKGADARWHQDESDGSSDSNSHSNSDTSSDSYFMGNSQSQFPVPVISLTQSVVRALAPEVEYELEKLLTALRDKDEGTEGVIRALIAERRLGVGDLAFARDAAHGPGVRSATKVAVGELKKRGNPRAA